MTDLPAADDAVSAEPPSASDSNEYARPETRAALLACIFVLLLFYTLYFAAEIIIPLIFALLLKQLLQPGYRLLTRARLPAPIAALAAILILFGLLGAVGFILSAPAAEWIAKAPQSLPRLEQHVSVLREPIQRLLSLTHEVDKIADSTSGGAPAVTVGGSTFAGYLFSGTRSILTGFGITILMLFFLLVAGDLFMRRLVEILPSFGDKKQAVEISREIEHNISAYLITISFMNLLVGIATALAMWAIGLPDPALWGTVAFVLNYVLILGPLSGLIMFFGVGLLTFPTLLQALLPPAAYLAIHLIEGEAVTPMLVARRFTLNPVLVIGSVIFWDWMWGIPGALVAVPLLAIFKIVCDRVRPLMAIGHFIEG
jgi:predicted PurR-regulated permease PerM